MSAIEARAVFRALLAMNGGKEFTSDPFLAAFVGAPSGAMLFVDISQVHRGGSRDPIQDVKGIKLDPGFRRDDKCLSKRHSCPTPSFIWRSASQLKPLQHQRGNANPVIEARAAIRAQLKHPGTFVI
jgi:hypothetical protein